MRASEHLIPVTRQQLTLLDLPFAEWVYCTACSLPGRSGACHWITSPGRS